MRFRKTERVKLTMRGRLPAQQALRAALILAALAFGIWIGPFAIWAGAYVIRYIGGY